jgi:hypothetical protein
MAKSRMKQNLFIQQTPVSEYMSYETMTGYDSRTGRDSTIEDNDGYNESGAYSQTKQSLPQ